MNDWIVYNCIRTQTATNSIYIVTTAVLSTTVFQPVAPINCISIIGISAVGFVRITTYGHIDISLIVSCPRIDYCTGIVRIIHFKVEMISGRIACRTHISNYLLTRNGITFIDYSFTFQMTIQRTQAIVMLNHNIVTKTAFLIILFYYSATFNGINTITLEPAMSKAL